MTDNRDKLVNMALLGEIFMGSLPEEERERIRKVSEMMVTDLCNRVKRDFEAEEKLRKYIEEQNRKYEEEKKPLSFSFGEALKKAKEKA